MRVIIAAIAIAFVFAGFRNLPRTSDPQAAAAGVVLAGAVVLAFVFGRRSVSVDAVATAVAQARADAAAAAHAGAQSVSSLTVNLGDGARSVAEQQFGRPEWIGGPIFDSAEQLEGSDASQSITDEILRAATEISEEKTA